MIHRAGKAWLALETGEVYEGFSLGARGESSGETVFNTGMSGYVEVLTDPSYCGQIVVSTHPHVGNYGIQPSDFERPKIAMAGFCIQDETGAPHHPESLQTLRQFLTKQGVVSVSGLPTREITLKLRRRGSLRGVLTTEKASPKALLDKARRSPPMAGRGLVDRVSTAKPYLWKSRAWKGGKKIAVLDFGVKRSLLDVLHEEGCSVKVFPAFTQAGRAHA